MTQTTTIDELAALIDLATSSQIVPVFVGGVRFDISFDNTCSCGGNEYDFDAHNVLTSIINLNNSPTMLSFLQNFDASVVVTVTNDINGDVSKGGSQLIPVARINVADTVRYKYLVDDPTSFSNYADFTIQHIVNHEVAHIATGLPDGEDHNAIVNTINSETQAGPPRLDYENAYAVDTDNLSSAYSSILVPPSEDIDPALRDYVDEDGQIFYALAPDGSLIPTVLNADGSYTQYFYTADQQSGAIQSLSEVWSLPEGDAAVNLTYDSFDAFGNPIGEPDVTIEHEGDITGADIGATFGAQIGNYLASDNIFAKIAVTSLTATIGQNIGQFSQSLLADLPDVPGRSQLDLATADALNNLGGDFVGQLSAQTLNAVGSILLMEAADALGLEGFEAEVFTQLNSTITAQVVQNAISGATGDALLNGIDGPQVATVIANIGLAELGLSPSDVFFDIDNEAEAILITTNGAFGAQAGALPVLQLAGQSVPM